MNPRALLASEVTWSLRVRPCVDLDPFRELAECYSTREEIQAGLAAADGEWGWCDVTVLATWGDWTGRDVLCACSYASAKDFKADQYYADMREAALASLNAQIQRAWVALNWLVTS